MLLSPVAMHIPDGFLSVLVAIIAWMISLLVVGYALKRVSADLGERQVPLMGVLAAAVFAGQMLNFTVTGGTSGHLIGAALVTALLGPWAGILVMTCVVGVQALIFQDGGLLTLGANLLNMAVISVAVAYFTYRSLRRLAGNRSWSTAVAGFGAGWLSVFIAALACALELALSATSPANVAVPAMAGIHALIGIGEGLITAGALAFVRTARPELLAEGSKATAGKAVWIGGLALAVLLADPLAAGFRAPRRARMGRRAAGVPGPCPRSALRHHPGLRGARPLQRGAGHRPRGYCRHRDRLRGCTRGCLPTQAPHPGALACNIRHFRDLWGQAQVCSGRNPIGLPRFAP